MSVNEVALRKKIGFEPHKCQQEVLDRQERDIAICAGRRFGKSAISAYVALRTIIQADKAGVPCKIWIVSPTYDLSLKVFDYLSRWYLKALPSQGGGISYRPFPQIKTAKGSLVQCKSAENPTGLLGEELDLLIVDEASRIPRNVYQTYLFPTTASRRGRTFFISTPFGKNWFYHKWVEAKGFHFTSLNNPNFPKEEWERAKKMLPVQVFKQEYEALFLEDAASVFRNIKGIIRETCEKDSQQGHYYALGVDLGKHEDFTVISVVDRDTHELVYWDRFNQIDYTLQKKRIKETADRYNNARIFIDSTVVGEPISEDLKAAGLFVDDYKFSMKSKKELIEKLSIFIEQQKLFIEGRQELVDELESFGYKLTDSGNIIYSAPEGLHDDCVYSLALAVWGLDATLQEAKTPIQMEMEKIHRPPNESFI